jgi:hypothetical protein
MRSLDRSEGRVLVKKGI